MAITKEMEAALADAHREVQHLSVERRAAALHRTKIALTARHDGATIPEIQALLGLSRTGVVKVLAGSKTGDF